MVRRALEWRASGDFVTLLQLLLFLLPNPLLSIAIVNDNRGEQQWNLQQGYKDLPALGNVCHGHVRQWGEVATWQAAAHLRVKLGYFNPPFVKGYQP